MQYKYKFDKETMHKIGISLLLSLSGGAAIAVLGAVQEIDFGQNLINGTVATIAPFLINTIREYIKGEKK